MGNHVETYERNKKGGKRGLEDFVQFQILLNN
jgi:hypothetical protein